MVVREGGEVVEDLGVEVKGIGEEEVGVLDVLNMGGGGVVGVGMGGGGLGWKC